MLKHTRIGSQQEPITLLRFDNSSLCVLTLLKYYISKTSDIRKNSDKLLISFQKPFKEVSCDTISRWIKLIMSFSGIDIKSKNIKAHSTRAQASSIASWKGISIATIMKAAGWSRETTFSQFYKKLPVIKGNIGQAVMER